MSLNGIEIWLTLTLTTSSYSQALKTCRCFKVCIIFEGMWKNEVQVEGHIEGRKKNWRLISDLCNYLEFKGYCVICPILSVFRSHQKKNRRLFKKYIQVYIKSSIEELKKRNNKLIYKKKNVVGNNIKFPEPYKSDIIVKNNFTKDFKKEIKKIVTIINKK